jgi:hypothetical protein
VVIDDAPPRQLEAFDVCFPARALEFEVTVRGHTTELEGAAPADPIGVLQIGQRKRCMPAFQIASYVTWNRPYFRPGVHGTRAGDPRFGERTATQNGHSVESRSPSSLLWARGQA